MTSFGQHRENVKLITILANHFDTDEYLHFKNFINTTHTHCNKCIATLPFAKLRPQQPLVSMASITILEAWKSHQFRSKCNGLFPNLIALYACFNFRSFKTGALNASLSIWTILTKRNLEKKTDGCVSLISPDLPTQYLFLVPSKQ